VESISKEEKPAFFFPPSIFLKRNDFAVKQRFFISKIMDSKKIKKRERGDEKPPTLSFEKTGGLFIYSKSKPQKKGFFLV